MKRISSAIIAGLLSLSLFTQTVYAEKITIENPDKNDLEYYEYLLKVTDGQEQYKKYITGDGDIEVATLKRNEVELFKHNAAITFDYDLSSIKGEYINNFPFDLYAYFVIYTSADTYYICRLSILNNKTLTADEIIKAAGVENPEEITAVRVYEDIDVSAIKEKHYEDFAAIRCTHHITKITVLPSSDEEDKEIYSKNTIKTFVDLLSKDKEAAEIYKREEIDGVGGGDGFDFKENELELLKSNENHILSINVDYDRWESTFEKYSLPVPSYKKEYIYVFSFFTSDYEHYTYKADLTKRSILTTKEILKGCKIPDSSKIVYGSLRFNECPFLSSYSVDKCKAGWNMLDENRCYVKKDGSLAVKSTTINGIRYKFTADGICQGRYTGWTKTEKGRRYYKNGVLLKNRRIKTKSGKIYYADSNGYATIVE